MSKNNREHLEKFPRWYSRVQFYLVPIRNECSFTWSLSVIMSAVPSCPLRYFWVKFHLIFFTNFECSFTWCHINAESSNRPLEIYFSVMQKRLIFLKLLFARGLIRVMRMTFEFSNQNRLKELKWRWRLVWDELSINWHKKRMQQLKIYRLKIKSTSKYNFCIHSRDQFYIWNRNMRSFKETSLFSGLDGQPHVSRRLGCSWWYIEEVSVEPWWTIQRANDYEGLVEIEYPDIKGLRLLCVRYIHYITLFRVPFAKVLLLSKTECHIPRHYLKIFIRK